MSLEDGAMTNLSEFLLARIAEDEAAARAATVGPWQARLYWFGFEDRPGNSWASVPDVISEEIDAQDAEHIARWNPVRVLAECDAKRRIVGMIFASPMDITTHDGRERVYTLFHLALPYADHPDYDPAWRL